MPFGVHPLTLVLLFPLLLSAFWIWMLIDCILNKTIKDSQKLLWFLLILFTHIIGALLYVLIGRSPQKAS
ncbi:PLD nuclease N-terminal domain-containing protein [Ktedonobacter sp. SOSP1-85]|uniref:PLD nuclease N-terminal domain-containing protein n=1 Tax=Ktedonobacter sp. SOSP1-85 TaxID=2778367 RepID=UPI001915349A|nr:PLD nuclease N-terminal domain-containing protein [Ktedonobacter sp. SOSP1-85]